MDRPASPAIPDSTELYNSLMSNIEPELTADQIPLMKEKYKNETPEERKQRIKRYQAAYVEYMKQMEAYIDGLNEKVDAYRKEAFAYAEEKTLEKEKGELAELETAISSA